MKELWVKKTVWRRYLIEDDEIVAVEQLIKYDYRGDIVIQNHFDKNEKVEYDNEETIKPIQYEVKAVK